MGAIDRHLLDVLLPALGAQRNKVRFITTGGCWLYGATGDSVATEVTPFRPLSAFAWMVPQLQRVLASPEVDGIVIHPAMVYVAEGGVFRRFAHEAIEREAIRVVTGEAVRWPLGIARISQISMHWLSKARRRDRTISVRPSMDFPSGALPAPSPSGAGRKINNRKSSPPTRSRPSWANGREAMHLTSG
jgi:hypothetical protein